MYKRLKRTKLACKNYQNVGDLNFNLGLPAPAAAYARVGPGPDPPLLVCNHRQKGFFLANRQI